MMMVIATNGTQNGLCRILPSPVRTVRRTMLTTARSLRSPRVGAVAATELCQPSLLTTLNATEERSGRSMMGRNRHNIVSRSTLQQSRNCSGNSHIMLSCFSYQPQSACFNTNLLLTRTFVTAAASSTLSSVVSSSQHSRQQEGEDKSWRDEESPSSTTAEDKDTKNSNQLCFAGIPASSALERALTPHHDEEWDSSIATSMEVKKQNLNRINNGVHSMSDSFTSTTTGTMDMMTIDPIYEDTVDRNNIADEPEALLLKHDNSEPLELRYAPRPALPWDELRHHIQTTRQLLQLAQAWTTEDWFQAETQCRNVWSTQHSVRGVVLQFALFHRALLEREALWNRSNTNRNNSNGDSQDNHRSDKWVGLALLNRMLSNWRLVYVGGKARELHSNKCHLSPPELLETIVTFYHDRFRLGLSEWTMYLLLDADVGVWRPETPQFSQEILDTTLELYQTGEVRCKPKAQLFNCILHSWIPASNQQLQQGTNNAAAVAAVREVFDCMKEHEIPPNGRTYKYALRLWSHQGTRDAALEAENLLQRMYADYLAGGKGSQPDLHAFNLVVLAWARSGSPDAGPRCEEIYRQMELLREKDHVFGGDDISVINNAILAYKQAGTVLALQHGEQFWRTTGVPGDDVTYNLLIKQYAHFGRIDDVERLIREKTALCPGPTTDLSTYVLVFKAYAESKLTDKAAHANELLQYLEQDKNNKLNTIVYNAYLLALSRDCAGLSTGEMSERVLIRMIEASKKMPNVRPDFVTYSTVMNAWARAGMPDRAARVLRAMYDDYKTGNNPTAKPDLQSFNTVLKAYTNAKYDDVPQKAEAFFRSMQSLSNQGELDIKPDNFSYAAVMNCIAKTKFIGKRPRAAQKVEALLRQMKQQYECGANNVRPNVYCYNNAIDAWARASNPNKAEEIFLEMCEDYKNGNESAKPQTVTFNILMKAWAFSRRPEAAARAEQILQQMHDVTQSGAMHVPPDIKTYTSLVTCLGLSKIPGSPQRAEAIVRHVDFLHKEGHMSEGPSRLTFDRLLMAWKFSNEVDKEENVARLQKELDERFGKPRQRTQFN